MDLQLLDLSLSVCRLAPQAPVADHMDTTGLWALTRTENETSVVCVTGAEPDGSVVEPDWRAVMVLGPLEFTTVGVLAELAGALATAGVSTFALSTYDTDYLLVKSADLARAVVAFESRGHTVEEPPAGSHA